MKAFYERYKLEIKALFAAPVIFIAMFFISKEPKFSCDNYAKAFNKTYECHMILSHKNESNGISYLFGADLRTHKQTHVEDGSKWIYKNFEKFHKGDTIIKNRGEYTITIKRNGATILIPFKCDRVYPDTLNHI
jgi:hypothetical protein